MIIIRILDVEGLTALLGAIVSASRPKKIVIEMPNYRRPSVIEHPLDHSSRIVLIPAESLEHRTFTIVGVHLCLEREVLEG